MNGKELHRIIKKSGVVQRELAERMGIHPTQFTSYFKQEKISSDVLERVAEQLGMTMGQLYGETAGAAPQDSDTNDRLKDISVAAMQSLMAAPALTPADTGGRTREQCIAELAVNQAMAMIDEFRRRGITP